MFCYYDLVNNCGPVLLACKALMKCFCFCPVIILLQHEIKLQFMGSRLIHLLSHGFLFSHNILYFPRVFISYYICIVFFFFQYMGSFSVATSEQISKSGFLHGQVQQMLVSILLISTNKFYNDTYNKN